MKIIVRCTCCALLVLATGCLKVNQALTLNRDGSGIIEIKYAVSSQAVRQMVQALGITVQPVLDPPLQLAPSAAEGFVQYRLIRSGEFSRGGWRRCPQVGNEVAYAEVRFMANRRHHRNARFVQGTGDCFIVEGHQVLQ